MFCQFENNKGDLVNLFLKNVTDPVGEFWEKKTLQQSAGVSTEHWHRVAKYFLKITKRLASLEV